jgi:uncharacterized protein (TIGR03382 family)
MTELVRVVGTLLVYLVIGVFPALLLGLGGVGGNAWVMGLPGGERLVPGAQNVQIAIPLGLGLLALLVPLVPVAVMVHRIDHTVLRWVLATILLATHPLIVLVATALAVLTNPMLLDHDKLVQKLSSPDRSERAFLYQRDGDDVTCGWDVYTAPAGPEITSTHALGKTCHCPTMPEAELVWTGAAPELQDTWGQPYVCTPPPSMGCSASGTAPALGLGFAALFALLTRRRRPEWRPRRTRSG